MKEAELCLIPGKSLHEDGQAIPPHLPAFVMKVKRLVLHEWMIDLLNRCSELLFHLSLSPRVIDQTDHDDRTISQSHMIHMLLQDVSVMMIGKWERWRLVLEVRSLGPVNRNAAPDLDEGATAVPDPLILVLDHLLRFHIVCGIAVSISTPHKQATASTTDMPAGDEDPLDPEAIDEDILNGNKSVDHGQAVFLQLVPLVPVLE